MEMSESKQSVKPPLQCGKLDETVTPAATAGPGPSQVFPRLCLLLSMTLQILHGHRTVITTVVVSGSNLYQFVSGSHLPRHDDVKTP